MGRIEKINIEDHMKESYINYSMSVIFCIRASV